MTALVTSPSNSSATTLHHDNPDAVRAAVREQYAAVANAPSTSCAPGCCGPNPNASLALGYTEADLAAVPEGANMGLGCGNPQAIAALREGETVIDLGSGGGFDCFLAARQVGAKGRVIGIDMTADMIAKARNNARTLNASNVEFRLGEIEHLPVANDTADVILSNCVINLSPDKQAVFRDAFRALKPGGRLAISDIVRIADMPAELASRVDALTGCIAGAAAVTDIEAHLASAGFVNVRVTIKPESREMVAGWLPGSGAENYVTSATIEAEKPGPLTVTRAPTPAACCAPGCCD